MKFFICLSITLLPGGYETIQAFLREGVLILTLLPDGYETIEGTALHKVSRLDLPDETETCEDFLRGGCLSLHFCPMGSSPSMTFHEVSSSFVRPEVEAPQKA